MSRGPRVQGYLSPFCRPGGGERSTGVGVSAHHGAWKAGFSQGRRYLGDVRNRDSKPSQGPRGRPLEGIRTCRSG